MGVLNISETDKMPLVEVEYEVIVDMTRSSQALTPHMIATAEDIRAIEIDLKASIQQLESVGPYMANIKELIKKVFISHENLFMETTVETDMSDNIHTWFLHVKSTNSTYTLLSVILRKKSAWYKSY